MEGQFRGNLMNLERNKIKVEGRNAVKTHLEKDGWQVLFFNNNKDYPVDVRAVKSFDKIVGHISYWSEDWRDRNEIRKKLNELKTEAKKTLAYPFVIGLSFDKEGTVQEIDYQQLL